MAILQRICFFCGAGNPRKALEFLIQVLQAKQAKITTLTRGFEPMVETERFSAWSPKTEPVPAR